MGGDVKERITAYWDETSDSEWYRSLRSDEALARLKAAPETAFHPEVMGLMRKYLPEPEGKRVLIPSSGDNHAAFAFALMGARVTSSDISPRQLGNASAAAEKLGLDIEFIRDDTMELARIPEGAYDLVYTSNGTLSWINDLDAMYRSVRRALKKGGVSVTYDMHPFNRPFSGEAGKEPKIVKPYHDVLPDMHWRVQDIVNAQIGAGLTLCEMAELQAVDASFWFTYAELQKKTSEELEGLNDWRRNPMAALPAWITIVSKKG